MPSVSFSEFQANLATHLDHVEATRTELVVTRQDHQPLVIMPLAELTSLRETLHLLDTSANATRLMASIAELEAGSGREATLSEP